VRHDPPGTAMLAFVAVMACQGFPLRSPASYLDMKIISRAAHSKVAAGRVEGVPGPGGHAVQVAC